MRQAVLDALALEADRALADARVVEAEKARDRPQRRGLAGASSATICPASTASVIPCTALTAW
jgi:hypothetical protein